MFKLQDAVRVFNEKGQIIKEGVVVGLTTTGARVYDPTCVHPYTDSISNAEWFPFKSRKLSMSPVGSFKKKKR